MINLPPGHASLNAARGRRLSTLWKITRADGEILRFTDHDEPLTFSTTAFNSSGDVFTPIGGVSVAARQVQTGLRVNNTEVRGVLNSDAITEAELRYGLYDEAEIDEYVVDPRYPFAGALRHFHYFIREVSWTPQGWLAQIEGLTSRLQIRNGSLFSKVCHYTLGDSRCTKNIETGAGNFRVAATVETITLQRKEFTAAALVGLAADNFYRYGNLVWTSGNNAGVEHISEVKEYIAASGKVVLQLDTPIDIVVGDGFNIYVGCDKTFATCISKFSNGDRFGGFPHIPGNDALLQTPSSK